ncbi:MAG TPA: acetoin utilization protein AcuC [Actinomycetota bacterium]|nr:acetoin utilization protein AcuC [Actinomycetota bacterium]
MADRVEIIRYGDGAPWYDLGAMHPLKPARVLLTYDLIDAYGIPDQAHVSSADARDATDDELLLVHTAPYVEAVKRAGQSKRGPWWQFGFGPGDNPIFRHMHEASARVAGASLTAAEALLSGRADHVFNPSGGLHHALPDRASGFCVYDDPAVAIAWLQRQGVGRMAYVDVDAHHGDGVQEIFYDDPTVLTISLHQSGDTLFPGTGFVDEIGGPGAEGSSVNVPLPPLTANRQWLDAFRRVVPPLLEAWKPEVLVTQLGCDTHCTDPLTNLLLTTGAYFETAKMLHELAHSTAGGKWLATGGGGYQWARVVPRAWTIYFAEMAETALDDELPEAFLAEASSQAGEPLPARLLEPEIENSPVTDADIDRVVAEVRKVVFPYHGLA